VAFVVSVGLCGLALVSIQGCSGADSQTVVGAKPSDVAKPFACRQTEICPGN
jgi:hypothetical protein